MTTVPAQRDAIQKTAYRVAAMLVGVGTVHFLAPKPFDDIVPAELPGSARFYTYASGVVEIATGALLVPRGTRRLAALAAARRLHRCLSGERQHVPVVLGQALADAHRRAGPVAAAGSDDHHGAEDLAQQLTSRHIRHTRLWT